MRRLALFVAVLATTAPGPVAAASAPYRSTVLVRVLNGFPGGPLTISTGGRALTSRLAFGTASPYVRMAHPIDSVEIVVDGTRRRVVLLSDRTWQQMTIIASGVGVPALHAVPDMLICPEGENAAVVRFVNASRRVLSAHLDLEDSAGRRTIVGTHTTPHNATSYHEVPAGKRTVRIVKRGATAIGEPLDVAIEPATGYTIAVVGDGEEPMRTFLIEDGRGLRVVPKGYVRSGVLPSPDAPVGVAIVGGLAVAVAYVACRRRGVAVLVAVVLLAACELNATDKQMDPSPTVTDPTSATTAPPQPPVPVAAPKTLVAGSRSASVAEVGIEAAGKFKDFIHIPDDVTKAYWYSDSPAPGEPGPAVVAVHRSRSGPFGNLERFRVGDRISVWSRTGRHYEFVVYRLQRVDKMAFPTREVYAPTPDPQLRLITCVGDTVSIDGERRHRENLVLYAYLEP